MRRLFDCLYALSGTGAALSLVAILCLVVVQMVSRWLGILFPGGANYAGYAMAAASFLALADTFRHNEHIRVSMLVERTTRFRRAAEIWCYTAGSIVALFLAWYAIQTPILSHRINDVSQGQDGTPCGFHRFSWQWAQSFSPLLCSTACWEFCSRIAMASMGRGSQFFGTP